MRGNQETHASTSRTTSASSSSLTAQVTALDVNVTDHGLRIPYYCEENVWRLAYRKQQQQLQQSKKQHGETNFSDKNENQQQICSNGSRYYVVFISNLNKQVVFSHQRAASGDGIRNPTSTLCWDYHVILVEVTAAARVVHQQVDSSSEAQRQQHEEKEKEDGEQHNSKALTTTTTTTSKAMVHDIDSLLPYPCEFHEYMSHSFSFCYNKDDDDDDNSKEEANQQIQQQPQQRRFQRGLRHQHKISFIRKHAPMFRWIPAEIYLRHFSSDRMHMYDARTRSWKAKPPPYPCIMPTETESLPHSLDEYLNLNNNDDEESLGQVFTSLAKLMNHVEYL